MDAKSLTGCACAAALAFVFTAVSPLRAAAVQVFAIVTCAAALPCAGGSNTGTGPGVQGTSSFGKGVLGATRFNSTASTNGQSGILGQDLSTAGAFDAGVTGTSTRGTGVSGVSSTGVGMRGRGREGVQGDDIGGNSDALFAKGHGGNLIRANNASGQNIFLLANDGTATFAGTAAFANEVDVGTLFAGQGSVPTDGVFATGSRYGVYGSGSSSGVHGSLGSNCSFPCAGLTGITFGQANSIAVFADGIFGAPYLFVGNNGSGGNAFIVDNAGNVHAHSFHADLAVTLPTSNGSQLMTYTSESRAPTIEDYGEATLVAGQAYVPLERTFAAGIDQSRPYFVFITPQGPAGGALYVAQKTAAGFSVRAEGIAVRPNVVFDYRIVARPYRKPGVPTAIGSPATRPKP
ncbi:MAG: hypothetical protein NVSMB64_17440 [Candidatus Velthaea sp.]